MTDTRSAAIDTAWGVRERRKGPKPALSLERIVDAAVAVADAEGLSAVSMARVASAAGTAPMSLYRHVSGKEELLELMLDAAWGPPPTAPPDNPDSMDWRAGLSRWAWGMRDASGRHPWTVRIPISGLPIMPNQVSWFESALVCMRHTGLTEARKASVIMLVAGYVRNVAATELDIATAVMASGLDTGGWMTSYASTLRRVADPARFPALTSFIEAGVFDIADGPDDEFIFGLERILDGIALLIDREGHGFYEPR